MDTLTALVGISTAIIGSAATATWNTIANRPKVQAHVTSVEFSGRLLSRVDQIEIPDDIAVFYRDFHPWILPRDGSLKASSNYVALGATQEVHNYIKLFLPKCNLSLRRLNAVISANSSTDVDHNDLRKLIEDDTIFGVMCGMAVRGEMPQFTVPAPNVTTIFNVEDITVDNKKIIIINLGPTNQYREYKTNTERDVILNVANVVCSAFFPSIRIILSAVKDQITKSKDTASELDRWMSSELDKHSTIIVNVEVANTGKTPVLINNTAMISINTLDGPPLLIPCISENFAADSPSDKSANRIIQSYRDISSSLELPLSVRNKVPLNKTFLPVNSSINISYRSVKKVSDLPNSDRIVSFYRTGENRAELSLDYILDDGKHRSVTAKKIYFGSNLELAEKEANKMLSRTP